MKRLKALLCMLCLVAAFSVAAPAPQAHAGNIEMGVVTNPPPPPSEPPPASGTSSATAPESDLSTLSFFSLVVIGLLTGLQGIIRP